MQFKERKSSQLFCDLSETGDEGKYFGHIMLGLTATGGSN